MDTRDKIITAERAAEIVNDLRRRGTPVHAVRGYFDVLQASHVRRLHEIADARRVLFAIIENPRCALMEQRARAELVAALAMIDYVVPVSNHSPELLRLFPEAIREEADDDRRTRELMEHVRSRHK